MTTYSLRPDVIVEPGIDGWYAWSYLMAPHSAAMLRRNHYRSIVEGYLASPETHATALRNPRMQGGPFVNGLGSRYEVIAKWWADAGGAGPLDRMAESVTELETNILPRFTGGSLVEAYKQLPANLRGLVELFYARDNHTADYRFIEPLVYASEFGDAIRQHVRFSFVEQDARDFALTTPLLEFDDTQLVVDTDLSSPLLDTMFAGRLSEEELNALAVGFGLTAEHQKRWRSYFTPDQGEVRARPASATTRVQYAGHACVLVEHQGTTILVDPVLSYSGYDEVDDERVTFEKLPATIDCLLISHNHQDHMLLETLLRIRHKVKEVVVSESSNGSTIDPNLPLILERLGFRVRGLRDLQSHQVGSMRVTALPFVGEHGDLRIQTKSCFHLQAGDRSMAFAADATNINPGMYDRIARIIGRIDTVFIGMECVGAPVSWLYGPFFPTRLERAFDQSRRLRGSNFDQAREIVEAVGADEVFVYAMGQEPWLGAVMCVEYDESHPAMVESDKLVAYAQQRGIRSKRLFRYEEILGER
ncbi:MBL fold metallo-hydrolase [Kineosporia babensis]|uniref:MBL fold metallo-hydrolase n=1 Tax=Kineosporia babensis TaxID=499548 RepID=A0A9X1SYE4_9ACTN|nr:MBL fold metallo-hydrolase [Kineosporia babensis]